MLCQSKLDLEMVWYYGWDYIHSLVFVQMPESLAPSVHVMIWDYEWQRQKYYSGLIIKKNMS